MTPQELKNSILQLAIQGKLVEQRPEEGTAQELYRAIQAEKQRLIKAGKIKKEKPLPVITEEEKPFEIPESWMWVRFGELGNLYSGYAFKSSEYVKENGIQVVRISDLENDKISSTDAVFYPKQSALKPYLIKTNSFLICLTGSIGKMAWVKDTAPRYLNQRVGMYIPISVCEISYLWQFLHTGYVLNQWIAAKTSTNGNIKNSNVTDLLMPLPPLAEQKRIVAKIEELLPYIDRYEQAWSRLEAFNKRFPDDMRKSILQLAIQGKLVEQRPEEGTAEELYREIQAEKQRLIKAGKIKKEKPLPEITEEEKPFEIPGNWKWVRLGTIISLLSGTDFNPDDYNNVGAGIPYITGASSLSEDGVLVNRWTEVPRILAMKGDVLLVCKGSGYGKTVICNVEMAHIARQIMALRAFIGLNVEYLRFFLMSCIKEIKANGQGVIPGIDRGSVLNLVFPLPPLAEQKRIVARLEELLEVCERLKTK